MAQQWSCGTESGILRKNKAKDKFEDLLVFGYACKLFRNDEKAQYIDQGKHLIPWMGDDKLKIDRYDCRGHLSDIKPYEASREGYDAMRWLGLSEAERKLEQRCDEERYYSLQINEEEEELYKEEEEKRKKTNEFQYSYDVPGNPEQEGIPTVPEANYDEEEYVPPIELDVPVDIPLPKTVKENARIERTALFVSQQGMQMEILIKTKQGDNPNLSFLNQNDPLFKYYRHVLSAIKNGRYKVQASKKIDESTEDPAEEKASDDHYLHPSLVATSSQPEIQPQVSSVPTIPYKPSANCTYSQLVNRIQGAEQNATEQQQQQQPVQPHVPEAQPNFNQMSAEQQQQYYQYYYSAQYYEYYKQLAQYQQSQGESVPLPEVPLDPNVQQYLQQMAYAQYVQHHQQHQNNSYAQIVSNVKDTSNPYAALLANIQQNTPVPVVQPSINSPNQLVATPPLQPVGVEPQNELPVMIKPPDKPESKPSDSKTESKPVVSLLAAAYGSGTDTEDSESDSESTSTSTESQKPAEEFSIPTGETQVIIDKMAMYVGKNGVKFEEIVKAKNDRRFDFLLESHEYNKYYRNKIADLTGETKTAKVKEVKDEEKDKKEAVTPPTPKKEKKVIAPVSFSIKKPKDDPPKEIKSALPIEESDEEEESNTTTATTSTTIATSTTTTSLTVSHTTEAASSLSSTLEKAMKESVTKAEPLVESSTEKSKMSETQDPPLSSILTQCMKKNGILDTDDPILEMIDLTDDIEERKDAKRAQDRIKDKLAAAAREKLASVARDKALQLERKKKAAAFLKLKSVLAAENNSNAKEPTQTSKESSRRSSIDSDSHSKEKTRDASKEKSSERDKSVEMEKEKVSHKEKRRGRDHRSRKSRERERTRSRSKCKRKDKDKEKHSKSHDKDNYDKYRLSDLEDYISTTPKKAEKIEVVQIDDSDSEEGEIKKKKKSSKKKKSHKRKHSKHDSRSRKKSKKKRKRSESSSSDLS